MKDYSLVTAETLATNVMAKKFGSTINYAIITGRERFLNILKTQNPLFFSVYGDRMKTLNDSDLTNFLDVMLKSRRIVLTPSTVESGAMEMGALATIKGQETSKIIENINLINS